MRATELHWRKHPERDDSWKAQTKEKLHLSDSAWNREYELSFEIPAGQPAYPEFDRTLNVRENLFEKWIRALPVLRGWDFGFHRPAVDWVQVIDRRKVRVYRAYMGLDIRLEEFARRVVRLSQDWFPNAAWRDYGDPEGLQQSDLSTQTAVEFLRTQFGIQVHCTYQWAYDAIQLLRPLFAIQADGTPGFLIDSSCDILIEGLAGGYHFKEETPGKVWKEEPVKDGFYDHEMNALEFIVNNELSPKDVAGQPAKRRVVKEAPPLASIMNPGVRG